MTIVGCMKLLCMSMLAAVAVSSTACRGATGSSSGPLDACALIGAARAGVLLGTAVSTRVVGPTATTPTDPSRCHYSTGSLHGGFLLNVKRIHYSDAKAEVRAQMRAAGKDAASFGANETAQLCDGPGEAAWLLTMADATQLNVLDHGVWLVINIDQPDAPAIRKRLRKLAQAAIDHLPR